MPRPKKCRAVDTLPGVSFFKPAGIPLRFMEEVNLTVEEFESLRLCDLEGLDQAACAIRMSISRASVQRVLTQARRHVAEAITQGKALRIEGGNYVLKGSDDCGHGRCCRRSDPAATQGTESDGQDSS
jgi:predicted DNA-binding protein (UPF0251 family)